MNNKIFGRLKADRIGLLSDGCYDGEYVYKDMSNQRKEIKIKRYIAITLLSILFAVGLIFFFGPFYGSDSIAENVADTIHEFLVGDDTAIPSVKDSFLEGILLPSKDTICGGNGITDKEEDTETDKDTWISADKLYDFDYSKVPDGQKPILPMDLSLSSYGNEYIHNDTGLDPDLKRLLSANLKNRVSIEYLSVSSAPLVLIIHTHGTEAYSEKNAVSYVDDGGEIARSTDKTRNVVAVGKVLKDKLNKLGINSIHCEILHDKNGYGGAYGEAEKTIKRYLEQYPSIKLVIDLHRDAIIKSSGELVRPVTAFGGKATSQIMCVVGSDWGGEENPNWERNLALALQLRRELNSDGANVCRPPYLKSATYNQEFTPFSLLLEIGAAGNSFEEACNAAELVAEALAKIL